MAPRDQKTCFACAQVDVLVQFLEPLKSGTKGIFWLQNSCQTEYFSNFSHLVLFDPRPHAPKAQRPKASSSSTPKLLKRKFYKLIGTINQK